LTFSFCSIIEQCIRQVYSYTELTHPSVYVLEAPPQNP
jgi:hypothetical protein